MEFLFGGESRVSCARNCNTYALFTISRPVDQAVHLDIYPDEDEELRREEEDDDFLARGRRVLRIRSELPLTFCISLLSFLKVEMRKGILLCFRASHAAIYDYLLLPIPTSSFPPSPLHPVLVAVIIAGLEISPQTGAEPPGPGSAVAVAVGRRHRRGGYLCGRIRRVLV